MLFLISTTAFGQNEAGTASFIRDTASMYKYRDSLGQMHYEQEPQFPGGIEAMFKYLNDNMVYPKKAFKKNIQGKVYTSFVVDFDGLIKKVKVVNGSNRLLNKEAIRVVASMPKWTPGWKDGNVVRVTYTLPLIFKITTSIPQTDKPN